MERKEQTEQTPNIVSGTNVEPSSKTGGAASDKVTGALVLLGVEQSEGWSTAIGEKNGKITLTASEKSIGYVVFGASRENLINDLHQQHTQVPGTPPPRIDRKAR